MRNPLIAVVGMPGAGKSTVVNHLAKRGWPVVYFGGITLTEMRNKGLDPSQENERLVREALREVHGQEAYAKLSVPEIELNLEQYPTIIDGLYSWAEYTYLRNHLGSPMFLIAICTDREIRYARLANRKIRPLTPSEAEDRDFAEIEHIQKGGPIAIADFTVLNNTSGKTLLLDIDSVLKQIMDRMRYQEG